MIDAALARALLGSRFVDRPRSVRLYGGPCNHQWVTYDPAWGDTFQVCVEPEPFFVNASPTEPVELTVETATYRLSNYHEARYVDPARGRASSPASTARTPR